MPVLTAVLCFVLALLALPGVSSAEPAPATPQRPASLLGVHSPFGDPAWPARMAELLGGKGGWLVDVVYSTDTDWIAGQSATCVDVPVPGGTSVYCALTNGPLARLDDGAVSINLTQYSPAIAESLFATTGNSGGQASTATNA
jgi:hypothetical protein